MPFNVGVSMETYRSGLMQEPINYVEMYNEIHLPTVLNDLPAEVREDREQLDAILKTNYKEDSIDVIPKCLCGELVGADKLGICSNCGTKVYSPAEVPIIANVWVRSPEGVAPFMNPNIWTMLNDTFKAGGKRPFKVLEWLVYTQGSKKSPDHAVFKDNIKKAGIKRGYNFFHENFDFVIETLVKLGYYTGASSARKNCIGDKAKEALTFIRLYRDLIFTPLLPIPNRLAFIIEKTSFGTYVDSGMTPALDAAITMTTITELPESEGGTPLRIRENRAAKTVMLLSDYYVGIHKNTLGGKPGWYRQHMFGTPMCWSGRCVITSISGPHHYQELHVPWAFAIGLLDIDLKSKLSGDKYRWSKKKIDRYLTDHIHVYDTFLHSLMEELILECVYMYENSEFKGEVLGLPVIFQRNPSLIKPSSQLLFITAIKTDVKDKTISMSTQVAKGYNADYDGDELNLLRVLSLRIYSRARLLAPGTSVFSLRTPREAGGICKLPNQFVSNLSSFISRTRRK